MLNFFRYWPWKAASSCKTM